MTQSNDDVAGKSAMLLVTSERFADHTPPGGHPERAERAGVMASVAARWESSGGAVAAPVPVDTEQLTRVHTDDYVELIASTAGRRVQLDPDTYTSSASVGVARLAAGAAVGAVNHTLEGGGPALAFVRPPGHHAERARAMGFCLFNNVAVAAAHAVARDVSRVAIIDYDVHHGNGTQWMFYDDPRVLYLSMHQYPFYPGTGAVDDVGTGSGAGFTVNVPLAAGAGDADYDLIFREVVVPVLEAFNPGLLLLSAGYDAHARDPLGGMNVSTEGYTQMTTRLRVLADTCCGGRIVAVTEGGYDLTALDQCLTETLRVFEASTPTTVPIVGSTERADGALTAVRAAQSAFWPAL